MPYISFKYFTIFVILAVTLAAGLVPLYARLHQKHPPSFAFSEALASGIFLGAALFHMLPSANAGFQQALPLSHYPFAYLFFALGFSLLLFLEKALLYFTKDRFISDKCTISYVLAIVLSIHALTEGMALGINITLATTLIIFVAILVHKGTESFALTTSLKQRGVAPLSTLIIFGIFSLMTPLGITLGSFAKTVFQMQSWELLQAAFNACAAGTFFYIATLHQKSHHHINEKFSHLSECTGMILGLTSIACLALWV